MSESDKKLTILGAGNIGVAIALGLTQSGLYKPSDIILTRRKVDLLSKLQEKGFLTIKDNLEAIEKSEIILIAVEPQQIDSVLMEIAPKLIPGKHIVISVVTGVSIQQMSKKLGNEVDIVRAMPNTAIAIRQSMTCLASSNSKSVAVEKAKEIFNTVGKAMLIDEELMGSATALAACGLAFFMRAIRAASQGGVEIGFHADKALLIAAQTAKGAASLLLENERHPEYEIDKVTTPRGVTISGLNQMEHDGFSSAMIKGIVTSAEKAAGLYKNNS
ncbi:MAG: pyrroline-5-carboxylate reductase [Calditrichaeota bacterium]|nr:MAG: pyrroline-5-carboxylate reductase [Calditrichota bacterium]MBL1205728.1 pyrroline-5-carboxylate reductase [Calditrichota bacterium]NOG45556.1 pyrroline-5-carboxylate reductase [Calditrichota bacterium]